jgi:hypothetical protein
MHAVTSFHASAVEPDQISAILAEYVAVERARIYRRLFVTRFGVLAAVLAIAGFVFHWLPAVASWCSLAVCAIAPTWAWVAELKCDRRLARSLDEIPVDARQTLMLPRHKKVVKSS